MPHRPLSLMSFLLASALTSGAEHAATAAEGFTSDFPAAKARALAEGKDLLLEFTGSDWCPPCQQLTREVFAQAAFLDAASQHYVLVIIDNPRGPDVITPEVRRQNDGLHADYAVNSWPTIFLADAKGRPYARTEDYRSGGPDAYLEHLATLQPNRAARDALLIEADGLSGVEQARKLDAALGLCGDFIPLAPYQETIDRIIAADAENAAGLKMRWTTRRAADQLEIDLPKLGKARQWRELVDRITSFLEQYEPSPAVRQKALYWRGVGHSQLGDSDAARASLEAAVAIDAAAEFGTRSKELLGRLRK